MKNRKSNAIGQLARGALVLLAFSALLRADSSIRVNAGGPAYTDALGNIWAADNGFTGGGTFSTGSPIANTADKTLYQSEHFGDSGGLEYITPAANGQYTVTLKFAEIYFTSVGQRVFNIVINGNTVQTNFDPFAAAGGANTAVDKTYPVTVTTGVIDIKLVAVVQNPKISAIEIDPAPSATASVPNFADEETPAGVTNGSNAAFSLAHTPNPATSLILVRNGLVMKQVMDYTVSGSTVTFGGAAIPQSGDTIQAFYRY
jgi:hypothetical protein